MLNKFHQTEITFIILLLFLILLFLCWTIHLIKMAKSVFFPPDVSFLSYQDQVEAFYKALIAVAKSVKDAFFLMFHFLSYQDQVEAFYKAHIAFAKAVKNAPVQVW